MTKCFPGIKPVPQLDLRRYGPVSPALGACAKRLCFAGPKGVENRLHSGPGNKPLDLVVGYPLYVSG